MSHSAKHPSTVPPEQAKSDLRVAFKESQVTKINSCFPVGSMNVHSTFHAKPAAGFEALSGDNKQANRRSNEGLAEVNVATLQYNFHSSAFWS